MDIVEDLRLNDEFCPKEVLLAAANEIERLRTGHLRYEIARKLNPRQWTAAWELNLKTGKPFDEIIDDMRPFVIPNALAQPTAPGAELSETDAECWRGSAGAQG